MELNILRLQAHQVIVYDYENVGSISVFQRDTLKDVYPHRIQPAVPSPQIQLLETRGEPFCKNLQTYLFFHSTWEDSRIILHVFK